ncbi:MAG: hypothetical protein JWQ49_3127 [Edaphobacter sp.]|nr:hypothetical protein [Edaphobacter sp.]
MGFYIRKGFNFGPLRLNLSRSGLGASFGVKGARIGVGPRGSYIHMGRGGLYYRQTLSSPSLRPRIRQAPVPTSSPEIPTSDNLREIASSAAVTMADSSATDLLFELNRVKKRTEMFRIALVIGTIVIFWLGLAGSGWWWVMLALIATIVLALYARHFDVLKGTAILNYALDGEAAEEFAKLQSPFRQLAGCEVVWNIDATGRNTDAKRNAGATTNLQRTEIRPIFSRPPKVQCNLEVPTLKAGRTTLYFFPDRLLVYDSAGVGAVAYSDLKVDAQESSFVESGRLPKDSRQVGTTWQYVNKTGGPDRRFNNNRQLPIMRYGVVAFSSNSGLNTLFMCSRSDLAVLFNGFVQVAPKARHAQV